MAAGLQLSGRGVEVPSCRSLQPSAPGLPQLGQVARDRGGSHGASMSGARAAALVIGCSMIKHGWPPCGRRIRRTRRRTPTALPAPCAGPLTFSTCATAASPDQQQPSVGKVPAECTREVTALDPGGLCRQLQSGTKGQAEPARTGRGPSPARRGRSPAVSKDGQLRTANGRHLAGYLRRSSSLVIALPRVDDYLVPGTITVEGKP